MDSTPVDDITQPKFGSIPLFWFYLQKGKYVFYAHHDTKITLKIFSQ